MVQWYSVPHGTVIGFTVMRWEGQKTTNQRNIQTLGEKCFHE